MLFRFRVFFAVVLVPVGFVFSQAPGPAGSGVSAGAAVSAEAAERYLRWAELAIGEGRWDEALGALERGADFADVSSDISYLLALVRYHNDLSLYSVLGSLRRAFETDRWESYSPAQGRFLEAEALAGLRMFSQSLRVLALAEQGLVPGTGGRRGGDPPAEGGGGEPEVRSQGGDEPASLAIPPLDGPYPARDSRSPIPRPTESDAVVLRLLALKGLGETGELLRALRGAMERYPRDPRPVGVLLAWAQDRMPESAAGFRLGEGDRGVFRGEDRELVDMALRRLPLLLEGWELEGVSPFGPRFRGSFTPLRLACLAAPFIRDTAEARRLVSAYRVSGGPERESIPVSLDLGIIDEGRAMEELFDPDLTGGGIGDGQGILDRDLIRRVWSLLRDRESRAAFRRRLLRFSGILTTDADGDGSCEERCRYSRGTAQEYYLDADQDGLEELRVSFSSGGIPQEAWLIPGGAPEAVQGAVRKESAGDGGASYTPPGGGIHLRWERYPAVLNAESDGVVYIPAPETFFYAPIRFSPLPGDDTGMGGEPGFLYPEAELPQIRLTGRTLVSFAVTIIRPSLEFPGGLERIAMDRGVPRLAVETLDDRVVAVTEFVRGQPRIQRVDLDLDGRMETIRRFREGIPAENPLAYERIPELVETDRDHDGLYEMGEQFFPDGTSIYGWDSDGDGIRDFFETRTGK